MATKEKVYEHVYESLMDVYFRKTLISFLNTLWTGDADLRFYITTVQDG